MWVGISLTGDRGTTMSMQDGHLVGSTRVIQTRKVCSDSAQETESRRESGTSIAAALLEKMFPPVTLAAKSDARQ